MESTMELKVRQWMCVEMFPEEGTIVTGVEIDAWYKIRMDIMKSMSCVLLNEETLSMKDDLRVCPQRTHS